MEFIILIVVLVMGNQILDRVKRVQENQEKIMLELNRLQVNVESEVHNGDERKEEL